MIDTNEKMTAENTGMNLTIALDYGSRQEIIHAVNSAISDGHDKLDETLLSQYLFTSDIPNPDLIIRSSGEHRVSNFLLWQSAYSEYYFSDILWPDFNEKEFDRAISAYNNRERRYGGVESVKA